MLVASIALAIWLYLIFARGGFWLNTERDEAAPPAPPSWPRVVAVVPARNEADSIGESIGSLLRQDYPGDFSIVLVDDDSDDGTADCRPACRGRRRGPARRRRRAGRCRRAGPASCGR